MTLWPLIRRFLVLCMCMLVAVGGFWYWTRDAEGTSVLVSTRSLEPGEPLAPGDFAARTVPPEAAPVDAITDRNELPETWDGVAIAAQTIVSESLLGGSPLSRAIPAGHVRMSVNLPVNVAQTVVPGDQVDLWAVPQLCDESSCPATFLASKVRVASSTVEEGAGWGDASAARVDLIIRQSDTKEVLGHSGTGTLTLVLRHRGED